MARIFITGSADGLGLLAAKILISQGHGVVLHARNDQRAKQALSKVAGGEHILTADISIMEETRNLASEVNSLGHFDAVIHNAGVYRESNQITFAVNSLAPYILTCLIHMPQRVIYLSSGLHTQGNPQIDISLYNAAGYNYSDTKLQIVLLAKAVARKFPGVFSNAVNPGWVPTKMGGAYALDSLREGAETQAWLAVSDDPAAKVSGRYFFHKKEKYYLPAADDVSLQDKFISMCEQISGVVFPKA